MISSYLIITLQLYDCQVLDDGLDNSRWSFMVKNKRLMRGIERDTCISIALEFGLPEGLVTFTIWPYQEDTSNNCRYKVMGPPPTLEGYMHKL